MSSIDVTVKHDNRFIICEQDFVDPCADVRQQIMRTVLDTQERAIREALIKMGWTPPKEQAASVGGEREAFERWCPLTTALLPNGHDYLSENTRLLWETWQARAALSPAGGGVVMPQPLKRGDEGATGEYGAAMIRGFNACLREVARLNATPQANSQESGQ